MSVDWSSVLFGLCFNNHIFALCYVLACYNNRTSSKDIKLKVLYSSFTLCPSSSLLWNRWRAQSGQRLAFIFGKHKVILVFSKTNNRKHKTTKSLYRYLLFTYSYKNQFPWKILVRYLRRRLQVACCNKILHQLAVFPLSLLRVNFELFFLLSEKGKERNQRR